MRVNKKSVVHLSEKHLKFDFSLKLMSVNQITEKKEWQLIQDRLAENSGLAIVFADETSPSLTKSNNNSICEVLYDSKEFAPECAKFCGKAFEAATEAGKTVAYKCYANLNCLAVPVKTENKQLVAIVGRTFLKAEDYRAATTRAISGDWQKFPSTEFFENVLFSSSSDNLEKARRQIEHLNPEDKFALRQIGEKSAVVENSVNVSKKIVENTISTGLNCQIEERPPQKIAERDILLTGEIAELAAQFYTAVEQTTIISENRARRGNEEIEQADEWRSLFGSLLTLTYRQACESVLRFVAERYAISSLVWLERKGNRLETVFGSGKLRTQSIQLSIAADDERLLDAVRKEISLELRERQKTEKNFDSPTIRLFPVVVGGEIRSALIVGDEISNEDTKRHISRFCQTIASQLEILQLREELSRRDWLGRAVQKINESLKNADNDDFWLELAQISAELMRAERSSLLIFDEKSNFLSAKAATGRRADFITRETGNLGEKIAGGVLRNGKPLIVEDVRESEISAAPAEREYKSNSFIIYPIIIGEKKIGVLNVTDRAGGESFGEPDLEILNAIMPQLAVLIDRKLLKHKAGEFEQLSVTDPLTGLLNRRYLDERLEEEVRRSRRDGLQMSLMMIDVDEFKSYNDNFSHPEGDRALKLVAHCLKDTLRGADVAARYGGEEFTILLPQTTSEEAEIIGERIRERVVASAFPHRQVTISVGVASCSDVICSAEKIIKAADDAVYEAKRQGRNNVQVYERLKTGEE